MRIEDRMNLGYEELSRVAKNDEASKKASGEKKNKDLGDQVSFSSDSVEVKKIISKVKNAPDVREGKVSEIKRQIDEGVYDFSGRKVAEKLVNSALNGLF